MTAGKEDRRIQKTRRLLREALVSLIHEKPYDAIAVTEILERANVGRSTFYTYFRDKDELLASGIEDMLEAIRSSAPPASASAAERIVRFARPVFDYHRRHLQPGEAGMSARGRAIVHERLRKALAALIADDVARACRGPVSADLLTEYVTSTFVLVLDWWAERESALPPDEIDAVFRALVQPTLAASCPGR